MSNSSSSSSTSYCDSGAAAVPGRRWLWPPPLLRSPRPVESDWGQFRCCRLADHRSVWMKAHCALQPCHRSSYCRRSSTPQYRVCGLGALAGARFAGSGRGATSWKRFGEADDLVNMPRPTSSFDGPFLVAGKSCC